MDQLFQSLRLPAANGSTAPEWRRDGREFYYLTVDGKLMAVTITPGADLKSGTPQALFAPSGFRMNIGRCYMPAGNEQRFLFVTSAEDAGVPSFAVGLNWMAELKKL